MMALQPLHLLRLLPVAGSAAAVSVLLPACTPAGATFGTPQGRQMCELPFTSESSKRGRPAENAQRPTDSTASSAKVVRQQQRAGGNSGQDAHPPGQEATRGSAPSSSESKREVEKFARLAQQWWSPNGTFAALHALNSARLHFLHDAATSCFGSTQDPSQPMRGLTVLDVGCGGGILAEPVARTGAHVLGIDPSPESIGIAQQHAARDSTLAERLAYGQVSAEALQAQGRQFDMVIASEVIEHVRRPADFVRTLAGLRKPGGCVVITTINRSPESYALAIVAAEKVLGMAPDGAHDWNKFLTPQELAMLFERVDLRMQLLAGMQLNLLQNEWQCTGHPGTNYAAMFCES